MKKVAPVTTTMTTQMQTQAILGVSDAVSSHQIALARQVAEYIDIPMVEVQTNESEDAMYVKNDGSACFACKTALYSALHAVAGYAGGGHGNVKSSTCSSVSITTDNTCNVMLFNGTNADDRKDQTRVGLQAADNFNVASPLKFVTKDEVRQAAKHLGLPNWNYAASPCLRSRLAIGVEATRDHLKMIETAENLVKRVLNWEDDVAKDFRVRLLAGKRAVIELDQSANIEHMQEILNTNEVEMKLQEIGFMGGLADVRLFKSGSVATSVVKPVLNTKEPESIHIHNYRALDDRVNDRFQLQDQKHVAV